MFPPCLPNLENGTESFIFYWFNKGFMFCPCLSSLGNGTESFILQWVVRFYVSPLPATSGKWHGFLHFPMVYKVLCFPPARQIWGMARNPSCPIGLVRLLCHAPAFQVREIVVIERLHSKRFHWLLQ